MVIINKNKLLGDLVAKYRSTHKKSEAFYKKTARLEIRALEGGLVAHADGETLGTSLSALSVECLPALLQVVTRVPA